MSRRLNQTHVYIYIINSTLAYEQKTILILQLISFILTLNKLLGISQTLQDTQDKHTFSFEFRLKLIQLIWCRDRMTFLIQINITLVLKTKVCRAQLTLSVFYDIFNYNFKGEYYFHSRKWKMNA